VSGVVLGWEPGRLTVILVEGGPWPLALDVPPDALAAGDLIELCFYGGADVVWTATITGSRVSWSKSIAQVTEIIQTGLRRAELRHVRVGAEPIVWYRGDVRVVER
jgi:hypothetical protein